MRKIIIILAILFASVQTNGQQVSLNTNGKCDGITQVELQKMQRSKSGKEEIRLLAKVRDGFDSRKLASQGITVGTKAGNIVTLRLPLDKIALLQSSPDILQYSISQKIFPTMDRTRVDTRTDSVQQGLGLPRAYTGKDVLIGITDWGFDYKHPNYNNNGADNRRLLRAWDQFRLKGPAPEGYDYGTEIVGRHDLLEAGGDTSGLYGYATHGTHVAGICAGRGIEGRYRGQAPDANLLFASFYLELPSWIDAVGWMKNVAKEEGKRLVINNSWGMYTLGPIDGTSLASQAINNLCDSGIVFVTSGGNCGDDKFHISHTFEPTSSDTIRTIARYYGYQEIGEAITFWGEPGKHFDVSFAMFNENDSVCMPWVSTNDNGAHPWVHFTDGVYYLDSTLVASNGDRLHFELIVESSNIFNGRPHVILNVDKNPSYGILVAFTANEGTVHAWNVCILENGAGNMGAAFSNNSLPYLTAGDNRCGIGEPACAEGAIAVAAHSALTQRNDGTVIPGMLASFSSKGPVIDGRRKPEISAPGTNVVSSISSYSDETYQPRMSFEHGGRTYIWSSMSGTSMSGPAVTGIVALMLEANKDLTPSQVRDILCQTAYNDRETGPLHANDSMSDAWGWGKVNALAAVNEALARVDIQEADESWFEKSLQVYPNPASERITIMTGRHTPERVTIYAINGTEMMSLDVVMEATVDISSLPLGVYVLKCGARTARVVRQ